MNEREAREMLRELFAGGETTEYPAGRRVECDFCGTDMTDDPRSGGFMFGSKATGPCCAAEREESIRHHREEWNIRARCPEGVAFADWVRAMRGPGAATRVTTLRTPGGEGP